MLTLAPKKSAVGFSLIELIIAIAIVGLVSAIAMPGYATWIKNSRVRTAAESIQNGLQTARAEAVKRNVPVEFKLNATLNSAWEINECIISSTGTVECSTLIEKREASEGATAAVVIAATPSASTKIVFNNLGSVTADPVPFSQLGISLSGADRPLRVTLGVGGNTRLCDPSTSLAASDPRRC